jgi:hypothetical protein
MGRRLGAAWETQLIDGLLPLLDDLAPLRMQSRCQDMRHV